MARFESGAEMKADILTGIRSQELLNWPPLVVADVNA
jgi:hypothetical protein